MAGFGSITGAGGFTNYTGTGGGTGILSQSEAGAQAEANQTLANSQERSSEKNAQTAAQAAMYPATLANNRFNQVYPWLQGQFGQLSQSLQGGGGSFAPVNGGPQINTGPVWTPNQIQQQINGQTAQNDAATAGQVRQTNQQTAGRGFGANSPLAQALGVMAQGQNQATNANMAQQTRWNAAQGNAQQQLAGQGLQEQQYEAQQQQQTGRMGIAAGSLNALLASLGAMA
jgi:hypothetical protein